MSKLIFGSFMALKVGRVKSREVATDPLHTDLIQGEASVVKVAGASPEANFCHAVVDHQEIPQL